MNFRDTKSQLAAIIKRDALKFGDFTLKSGTKSHFYLDLRLVSLSRNVSLMARAISELAFLTDFDVIGGPCVGADPIIGAFIALYQEERGFLVRKQEKGHGMDGLVIGPVRPGDRCIMVEDVSTTGGSMMVAIEAVEAFGAQVVMGIAVVDRSAGKVGDLLATKGIPFRAVLTLADLDVEPETRTNQIS